MLRFGAAFCLHKSINNISNGTAADRLCGGMKRVGREDVEWLR